MISDETDRQKRLLQSGLLVMNVLMAVLTSFGIPEIRYTAVIWPLAALHFAALYHLITDKRQRASGGKQWIK